MRKRPCRGPSGKWLPAGRFICFSEECVLASFAGAPEYALAALTGTPLPEIQAVLYGFSAGPGARLEVPSLVGLDPDPDEEVVEELAFPELGWPLDYVELDHPHAAKGVAYLRGRGVPEAVARMYGVMYSPIERRVVFPVQVGRRLLGWQGRLIVPHEGVDPETGAAWSTEKIKSSDNIPPVWMFQDRLSGLEHAVLCEGPVDAIKAHACGGNIACMGISRSTSPAQVRLLRDAGVRRIYLALDPDAALTTQRLVEDLSDMECYQMDVPTNKDLGAMTFRQVYDLWRAARPVSRANVFVYLKPDATRRVARGDGLQQESAQQHLQVPSLRLP